MNRVKSFLQNILFSQSLINFVVNSNEKLKKINDLQENLIELKNKKISLYEELVMIGVSDSKLYLLNKEVETIEKKESQICKEINDLRNKISNDFREIKKGYNDKKDDLIFIEVQTGDSFEESDIVRIQDDYGR